MRGAADPKVSPQRERPVPPKESRLGIERSKTAHLTRRWASGNQHNQRFPPRERESLLSCGPRETSQQWRGDSSARPNTVSTTLVPSHGRRESHGESHGESYGVPRLTRDPRARIWQVDEKGILLRQPPYQPQCLGYKPGQSEDPAEGPSRP